MAAGRVFRVEFRIAVAQRILNGESVSALSNEFKIRRSVLYRRRDGYRRVTAELRAQGRLINRKRVVRLMRADNLLCLRKRRFVCTTDSRHTYAVGPNLTRDWKPAGINQL
jgi:putative transposase